jgi:DNA replication protein DnaC
MDNLHENLVEWTEILGSKRHTGTLLDRLTHHIHILEMNGDSYRLKQSRHKCDPVNR